MALLCAATASPTDDRHTASLVGSTLLDTLLDVTQQFLPEALTLIKSLIPLANDLAQRVRGAGAEPAVASVHAPAAFHATGATMWGNSAGGALISAVGNAVSVAPGVAPTPAPTPAPIYAPPLLANWANWVPPPVSAVAPGPSAESVGPTLEPLARLVGSAPDMAPKAMATSEHRSSQSPAKSRVTTTSPPPPLAIAIAVSVSVAVPASAPSAAIKVTVSIAFPNPFALPAPLRVFSTAHVIAIKPRAVAIAKASALVSLLQHEDWWETTLSYVFRDLGRTVKLAFDLDQCQGRVVLAVQGDRAVAHCAATLSWVVVGGALFETLAPIRNPHPRPVFLMLNLPNTQLRRDVIVKLRETTRARDIYADFNSMSRVPLPNKRSAYAFVTVHPTNIHATVGMDGLRLPGFPGPLKMVQIEDPPAFFACDSRALNALSSTSMRSSKGDMALYDPCTASLVCSPLLDTLLDATRQYSPEALALIRSLVLLIDDLPTRVRDAGAELVVAPIIAITVTLSLFITYPPPPFPPPAFSVIPTPASLTELAYSLLVTVLVTARTPSPALNFALTLALTVAVAVAVEAKSSTEHLVALEMRVSRPPRTDWWETTLTHAFRNLGRPAKIEFDPEQGQGQGQGRIVLVTTETNVAQRAANLSWVVVGGALFEIIVPTRNPTPRPVFLLLNLPNTRNRHDVIVALREAARARYISVDLDYIGRVPMAHKQSGYAFVTVSPSSEEATLGMDGLQLERFPGPLKVVRVDDPPSFFARGSHALMETFERHKDEIL
ncbi:hypothetical protein GGF32_009567 [Allomyces javanicus]|nr:hypothetical protein GGF32_009567 [Allomyces javanicus]